MADPLMRLFALGCLVSVVVVLRMSSIPSLWVIVVLLLILLMVGYRWDPLRPAVLGAVSATLVLSTAWFDMSARQLDDAEIGVDIRLAVRVDSVPQRKLQRLHMEVEVLRCLSCNLPLGPQRLQLSWYGADPGFRAGETWELTARLKPMAGLRNPGGFDRVRWAIGAGLHARGYVRQSPAALRTHAAAVTSLPAIREALAVRLAELPAADEFVGLVQALTLGVRSAVQPDSWELLRQTGTAHLLAISGLHISLLAAWGYVAGRAVARGLGQALGRAMERRSSGAMKGAERSASRWSWLRIDCDPHAAGLLTSLLLALVYALLAGFALSTQRALIMLTVWVVASLRWRVLRPGTGLCVALAAVLLSNPFGILSTGFWLSFGTVACLFYLHQGHQRPNPDDGYRRDEQPAFGQRLAMQLPPLLRTHVLLGLLLLPMTAWFFQSGSLIAPLANLIAVPWVGAVVVPLCFLSPLCAWPAPWLASHLLQCAQWAIAALLQVMDVLANVPAGSVTLVMPSLAAAVLCLSGLLVLLSPRGLGLRWLGLPMLLPALAFNLQQPAHDGLEVHTLDVGQGLAVLVFSDQQTLLFDTGGKVSTELSMFEAVVMPFMRSQGRRRIDTLVVSHTDEDHAFGVSDLLRRFPDVRILSSASLEDLGVSAGRDLQPDAIAPCKAGTQWHDGTTVFSFLHPAGDERFSDNDRSCVLLVHHGASRVLLTGDIEAAGEKRLVERLQAAQSLLGRAASAPVSVDLMIAPHHGSRTSSTQALLDVLQPRHIVFPAGMRNRYGFPHVDVQSRYERIGAVPYITGTEGAVSFRFNRSGLDQLPSTWWQSHRRFWHGYR